MSDFPEINLTVSALLHICQEHTVDGVAIKNDDCGACGSRQDAAVTYLLSCVDVAKKELKL